jgi:dihydrodiol dehydrogenase / D-xylose 1-dehydrogenase (NADP)
VPRSTSTKVVSATKMYPTGVDETTTMSLTFPRDEELGGDVHTIVTASMSISIDPDDRSTAGPCVRIQGDRGELQVFVPSYHPTRMCFVLSSGEVDDKMWEYPGPEKGSGWYNGFGELNTEGEGHGMFWEADEAAMVLIDGGKEGRLENLNEVGNMIVRALHNVGKKHTQMM